MAKFQLDWHRICLANSRRNLAEKQTQLARMQSEVQQHLARHEFYAAQIAEAERRGMDGFDSSRLLIKKRA